MSTHKDANDAIKKPSTAGLPEKRSEQLTALQAGRTEGFEKSTKPVTKASHGDQSDYSDDYEENSPDKGKSFARQMQKDKQNKEKHANVLGKKGRQTTQPFDDQDEDARGSDEALDELWDKMRSYLSDVGPGAEKLGASKDEKPNKVKLLEHCTVHDPTDKGVISRKQLQQAFAYARLPFVPTEAEWDKLITALDAWEYREQQTVHYRRFLSAPSKRLVVSVHGIFPKIQGREATKFELERKAKMIEEEKKGAEKAVDDRRLLEEAKSRKLTGSATGKAAVTKEEARKNLKEEQMIREQEKKQTEMVAKEEERAVKAEIGALKTSIVGLQERARKQGGDVRKWFQLFDSDKSKSLDQTELSDVLQHAGIRLPEKEVAKICRLLDRNGDGSISYNEFCDVIEGRKVPDFNAFVVKERARSAKEETEEVMKAGRLANIKSMAGDVGSSQVSRDGGLGKVEGLSTIMGRSNREVSDPPPLVDEGDALRVQSELKELLRAAVPGKPTTFDDLLQMMGKPKFQKADQITLSDLEAVVKAAGGSGKFSAHDIKSVFRRHAVEPPQPGSRAALLGGGASEPYIPLREFKDKFLPAITWAKDEGLEKVSAAAGSRKSGQVSDSGRTESMVIDAILESRRPGDLVTREKPAAPQRPATLAKPKQRDADERSQAESIDSRASRPIEDIVGASRQDPRKKQEGKQLHTVKEEGGSREPYLSKQALEAHEARTNESFFRQPEAVNRGEEGPQTHLTYDKSLDRFFKLFCRAIVEEAHSGPKQREVEHYVDHYGKERPGYLSYAEFKEVFETHAYPIMFPKGPVQEEGKILALFHVFDVQSRGKIPRDDFVSSVNRAGPTLDLLGRLGNKVRKGGERLIRALTEEFQEADAPFGCNGQLPLNNFQVIMSDYDLPLLQADLAELEKRGFVRRDELDQKYVDYAGVLAQVRPKAAAQAGGPAALARAVVRLQAAWRGRKGRVEAARRRNTAADALGEIGEATQALRTNDTRTLAKLTAKGQKGAKTVAPKAAKGKQVPTKDSEGARRDAARGGKARQAEPETLEVKMAAVARPGKEGKFADKLHAARKEMSEYLRATVIEQMIEAAFCYGESLGVCRTVQRRFETRPVTKFLYPMIQEFQFGVQGVLPKSLQAVNGLGQVMCLDAENQLNQFDVASVKSLQSVNLGTRPPLKHYNIIDMVCDQASGRLYTLNANWILEIWSIEQDATFPQKRLAVCANDGGKDFISLYYQQTFNNSKPRFLSLQASNQQILVVNTSCVDGSIVFIDPISFSVLKKIQLRYSDYEIPKAVRESIRHLRQIFEKIRENQGKDVLHIFADITDRDTQEVKIRDFVAKLLRLDPTLGEDELYKACRALDNDGSGSVSLDEFLEFFGTVEAETASGDMGEDELEDEMWPEWLIREGKLPHAQSLLAAMFGVLEHEHGITAEQAFGIYDIHDTGDCSTDEFSRVLKIFFGEAIPKQEDLEFVMRLTQKKGDQRIDYRDFCKFLSKRVVRTFKTQGGASIELQPSAEGVQTEQLSGALQRELQRPLKKEASLTYVLRKTAELSLDLRKLFVQFDKSELSVIPRSKFAGILLDLPLGLNQVDVQEILENDLHFDNYGNVDYTVVLNSDLFCTLERQRLKATHRKRRAGGAEAAGREQATETEKVDNRKVVVEDLIYIDDLEILIYTTVAPKTSTVFISSVKKATAAAGAGVEVVTLAEVGQEEDPDQEAPAAEKQASLLTNYYQLLAKLKGHKNSDPPTLCYVPQSCCLVTGEKHLDEQTYAPPKGSFPGATDPSVPSSHKFQKSNQSAYEKHQSRGQKGAPCEILIWNLQRDLIELFQSRPPWNVPCHKRIQAHNASIVEICYLPKAHLVVTASMDQTIKFFDPASTSYELTDPSNNPHAEMRPGHYRPLKRELTRSNITFKEVKRIYTGSDTSCFSLRCLHIENVAVDPANPELKSQIEWLVALKLGKPSWQQSRNTQVGFICGYGIERVQIEVPALHHDDVVPPFVLKECEELVTARRRKVVSTFQRTLQQTISKIFSQVQLQSSQIAKVRAAFMRAILQRKELKYVNPEPLREIYRLLLTLPDRSKFQSFLASSGCSDKLSVSETFFYLQKFQQIHPLRTTQIEFERSIQEFHDKHSRQFLKGVKRWPKASVQRFADHIRQYGLDLAYLQSGGQDGKKFNSFCTREKFAEYFAEVVTPRGDYFTDLDIDSILNDLDPFYTGAIQIALIKKIYAEEIQFHAQTSLSRPNEILEDIRTLVFPNKRVQLQLALASADVEGDGYLQKDKFIEAFQQVGLPLNRDTLDFLFNVLSETYTLPKTEYEPRPAEAAGDSPTGERVLSLTFFMTKLFRPEEQREVDEIDKTLGQIKAALVYKGLDFSVLFAEQAEEGAHRRGGRQAKRSKEERKQREVEPVQAKKDEPGVDLTLHYTRFAQQIVKEEFCRRVESLHAAHATPERVRRLATFLALNQQNQTLIYLSSWLHHLRRANTAFHEADRRVLPFICAKLLRNERLFRSWLDSCGHIRGKREEEKFIQQADLRSVLTKFGVSYINQEMFLNEFTRSEQVHTEDLIALLKSFQKKELNAGHAAGSEVAEATTVAELRKTDYFSQVHQAIRGTGVEIDIQDLLRQFRDFDVARTGSLKVYILINVLKHNYRAVFSDECLIGLQFQLECLSGDGTVDYEEFTKIFLEDSGPSKPSNEMRVERKSAYNLQDYEDLLSRISTHVKAQGLDLMRIFEIFCKRGGFITFDDLRKILDLIEFPVTEHQLELIRRYADENEQGTLHAYEFVNLVVYSREITPAYAVSRWITASRELVGRYRLLELVQGALESIKDQMLARHGDSEGRQSGVLTAGSFAELLAAECPQLSESDKHLLCVYAVKGSRRVHGGSQSSTAAVDVNADLVQFFHFEQALEEVVQHVRKEAVAQQQNQSEDAASAELAKFRKQVDEEVERQRRRDTEHFGSAQAQRMQALKNTVVGLFQERDITFFDCFQSLYDPLNPRASIISVSDFKKRIRQLNLPLSVQDHRLLRRIADPGQIGKVEIKKFCSFFETADLRQRRLHKILDKVATAFFLQGFNMRRAFALFDADGDGSISAKEFRQGMGALNLHLRYDEIDDLMHVCDVGGDGEVSYDEFISKMDVNIKSRSGQVLELVEEAFFDKLGQAMEYSRETLYDIMQDYDFERDGTIDATDLPKVIKKLGIMNPDPHLRLVLQAGRCGANDKRIHYGDFSLNLEAEIMKRKRLADSVHERLLQKIAALLKSRTMSIFEFFVMLDVNGGGSVSSLELKTGVQQLGLSITPPEFQSLWGAIYRPVGQMQHEEPGTAKGARGKGRRLEPAVEAIAYLDLLNGFSKAGCLKLQQAVDNQDALLSKFRAQLKKNRISVEKAFKTFDPNNHGTVQKKDFVQDCQSSLGLQFSEEELQRLFECICAQGAKKTTSNDQQTQQQERGPPTALTRFNYKQLQEAVLVQRDENWLFQACIKIHAVVLQKGLSYKRLFTQWREKSSKTTAGRLTERELAQGLKRLKAGLTTDEIEKLCGALQYEGKDNSVGAVDFEKHVIDCARKLETERSFERMILQEWIVQFNDCLQREGAPLERLFYEHDTAQAGALTFPDFAGLNEQIGLCMQRKDLQRIFGILDRKRTKLVRLEDLKGVASLLRSEEEGELGTLNGSDETNKRDPAAVELDDLYEKVKEALESLNLTLEAIVYSELKYLPTQLATVKGLQQVFERLEMFPTKGEAERVLADVRQAHHGKFECSFKHFIDFMTRKRINVAFVDKGFIDPLIAQCCQHLSKAKDQLSLTFEQLFGIFDGPAGTGTLAKETFLTCVQGLELDIALEDLMELFNYMDTSSGNALSKVQFVDALTYVTTKLGGTSFLDTAGRGLSQTKKGTTNRQAVLTVLGKVAEAVHKKQLQMRQVIQVLDVSGTGYISRAEFSQVSRGLCESLTLDQARVLLTFFDERGTGRLAVAEVVALLQDLINQQIGGGVYAYLQVQPLISRIINQLAVDADKFFDEVAFQNDALLKQEAAAREAERAAGGAGRQQPGAGSRGALCGLSKRLFFGELAANGVALSEQEKALFSQVFALDSAPGKLDYLKLDQAFEGEQQHLYALEEFYTVEWERRVFRKIGEYLKKHNLTIETCFDLIDDDGSQTASFAELKQALARFDLRLSDQQVQAFLARLGEPGAAHIGRDAFIKRFWSAFTYDDVRTDQEPGASAASKMVPGGSSGAADGGRIASGLQQKLQQLRMLRAIQERIKAALAATEAFTALDSGVGFLTLGDFQAGLPLHFDLTLRQHEVSALFAEVDSDGNGVVKYAEWDGFYRMNFDQRVRELESEKERLVTQHDIFDHLLKVLKQKGLTLEEMFDQIDLDKNQFIEVDEFHQTLECMGFLISEEQVFELMRQMDDNFDGRISYAELRAHILRLGFQLDKTLESRSRGGAPAQVTTFAWRDKGLELIIQALHRKLEGQSYEQYLSRFDHDHDGHLTPSEFRQALLALKEAQLGRPQIERVLHVLLEEKQSSPLVAVERMAAFLRGYKSLGEGSGGQGSGTLLIDEDLFVYIVERYDGFSRLVEQFNAVEERAQYIARHTHEINLRGLDMLANQMNLGKIYRRSQSANSLYEATLVLLAGEANRLIRDEAQLCVLDPTTSINTIVTDANVGALSAVGVPLIENSQFEIDYSTLTLQPSGAQRYSGVMPKSRKQVEVLIYPNDYLTFVSADGKAYGRHLQFELQVHRYLMGAHYEEDAELDPESMSVFPNFGKFEKKIGLAASDKEIFVVNELVDEDAWINLDDFVTRNGGILNIPLFYHTDAPLFIVRHWARLLLTIIKKVHDVSAVLRCLQLGQVWVSRDGQKIKLGHVRGVGKVNNFGSLSSCPDVYLSLENNGEELRPGQGSTTGGAGQKPGTAAPSSKKTDGVRHFSNRCLDNPFIAPETLFLKFLDQSAALDVWSFGMIMYCLLLGKKPESYYSAYRTWYRKCHGHDIEMATLPFIPPSQSNFLYDPFSIDLDDPLGAEESQWHSTLDIPGSLSEKESTMNFENFIKCLKGRSYSSLFTQENSKKFHFKSVGEQLAQADGVGSDGPRAPRYPGQPTTNEAARLKMLRAFSRADVLARKNELGLILDLISSCLDADPKRRPTIAGLLGSPLFQLDAYEMTKAVRFSQNVILYRSPQSTVSMRLTAPLRGICCLAIKHPERLLHVEADILKMFAGAEDCVAHISTLPLEEISEVLTQEEKRRALADPERSAAFRGKDGLSQLRVSPNSPLAAQVVEDRVVDMLIFLTFRYTQVFTAWKRRAAAEPEAGASPARGHGGQSPTDGGTRRSKSVRFGEGGTERSSSQGQPAAFKNQGKRAQNLVLQRMTRLLKTLVYALHSYSTPMAPYVKEVVEYVLKLYVGEEYELGSDCVLRKTDGGEGSLKEYLRGRSFFRREADLGEDFKSDATDKAWHLEQRNLSFLDKSNHWSLELHQEANKIYRDAITESGMGQSCYPVLNDYITNVTNAFEPSKIFSKQMSQLSLSYLIPMNRTTAYYNELGPITECLSRLYSPDLEKAGKRCALAMIRSVFQTGSSDKIKACLDMRAPKHVIHFLQDSDAEVRKECLLTLLEMSKGLQDEDFEIMGKTAANLKQEYSRRGFRKTAFDQHKAISLASQSEAVGGEQDQDVPMEGAQAGRALLASRQKGKVPQATADGYSAYIKRTIALIEKNENERFINFALDLPNLNFLASKRFLREMAVCFESPVFITPLTRLLKAKTESFQNKEIILQIGENLFCGNERVLTALNSPACDAYMTLLRLLMQSTKTQHARANPSGLSAQMRQHLQLQDRAVGLFRFMFEQRRPTIIRDLNCIGAASTLLREQGLRIPELISLPDIVARFDDFAELQDEMKPGMIVTEDYLAVIKDLRCWVKHFYEQSAIPELTRIKALQRCCSFLLRVVGLVWGDYKDAGAERRLEHLQLIKASLQLFDWLCVKGKEHFLFNEQCGRENLAFIIDRCNVALAQFRAPADQTQLPLEDLAFDNQKNKQAQARHKYDMFPFTEIGAILQNILYQLVRKDSRFLNQLLAEANFGFVFGEQLILEYDFIRHCIDNKIESMVLIDSYVKKNEIRLNTYEYLLRSSEPTMKDQLLHCAFMDRLFGDYIGDFREFNIQFSKIDLEFLAFRRSFPIRLECISLINTTLMLRQEAPRVFTELVQYARRHFLVKEELDMLRRGRLSYKESTALLLFAILLESNVEDLIYVMMQEGAPEVLRRLTREHPSLGRNFPIVTAFATTF